MKTAIFIALLVLTINGQAYDVDNAMGLLQQLRDDSQASLDELDNNWLENSQLLMENVASAETSFANQTVECHNREDQLMTLQRQQTDNNQFLQWLSDKIAETNVMYNAIYESRCQANRNYIGGLGKNKLVLELVAFLRTTLENVDSVSLIQKKELNSNIFAFVQLYKNSDIKGLLQLKSRLQNKQNEQTSALSADLQPSKLTGQDWIDYRDQLLALLDQIHTTVSAQMDQAALDEMNAGLSAAQFRGHLEGEIQQLDRELYKTIEKISYFEAKVIEVTNSVSVCHSEKNRIETSMNQARQEYTIQLQNYNDRRGPMQDELDVFEFVFSTYNDSVYEHADSYREAVDDFGADGQLDGTYTNTEVNQMDFINQ